MDERDLEQRLREGLEVHAAEADVTARVVAGAAEVARRRRVLRWGGIAATAAAVVVIVGGVSVMGSGGADPEPDDPVPPLATDPTDRPSDLPIEWRTEHWAGLAVDVPAEWGYGGAPFAEGTACFPTAMVDAAGAPVDGTPSLGHVGRPIAATDVCARVPAAWQPTAPYVWLGAEIEAGTYEYDNGYVQETVAVEGTTLTVGSNDAALRQDIFDSARPAEGGCAGRIDWDDRWAPPAAGQPAAARLRVCAYRVLRGQDGELVHQTEVDAAALRDYLAAASEAASAPADPCPTANYIEGNWVVLEHLTADGTITRRDVVRPTMCGGPVVELEAVWLDDGDRVELTAEMSAPWAVRGIPATVAATQPPDDSGWIYDYFIGPQG